MVNFKLYLFISITLLLEAKSQGILIKARDLDAYCEKNLYKIIINITIDKPLEDYISFNLNAYTIKNILFKCMINPLNSQIICITNLQNHKISLKVNDSITLPYPFPEVEGIIWDYNSFLLLVFRRTIKLNEECGESVIKLNISKLNPKKWSLISKVNKIYGGQCLLSDTKENYYSFNMNLNIIGGNLKEKLDELKDGSDYEINFMQNITMPFTIGPLQNLVKNNNLYKSHDYYQIAFCYPKEKINSTNYLNKEGINFHCDIPISDQYIFNGPLRISTFSDNIYCKIVDENEAESIGIIALYFTTDKNPVLKDNNNDESKEEEEEEEGDDDDEEEFYVNNNSENDEDDSNIKYDKEKNDKQKEKNNLIKNKNEDIKENNIISSSSSSIKQSSNSSVENILSSSNQISSSSKKISSSSKSYTSSIFSKINSSSIQSSSSSSLRRLQNLEIKKKKQYLLLDNKKNNFICPDKPIFEITNIQNGIIYQPIPEKDDKYNLILNGYLKNGYKISDKKIIPLDYTPNEIKFNLSISNNLVEESSEKKRYIPCSLSSGSFFLEKEINQIKCFGDKSSQENFENTDITINWASKENKYLNDILIKWPKDLTIHSKNLYSYKIHALSIKKTNHGCYDDKYYFYINILNLNSEPQISFEFKMLLPNSVVSKCKLYNSKLLKCYLELRLKRVKKGAKITLPIPGNYNISTIEGNYINFTVLNLTDENGTDLADEGIIAEESCGNNVIVGAIQDIGYGYWSAIGIIIAIVIIFFVAFFWIGYCVIFEITHRNKKGKYFAHTEEKSINNSNISTNPIGGGVTNTIQK